MTATTDVTVENIELSPSRVKWNLTDVGATTGNVLLEIKYMKGTIKADQHGLSVLDERVTGVEMKVTTEIAEVRDINKIAVLFPTAVLATSGPNQSLTFFQPQGFSSRANARELNVHPIVLDDGDVSNDHTFFLTYPKEDSSLTYSPGEQVKGKIVWAVFPVLTGNQPKWYCFGDPSVGT